MSRLHDYNPEFGIVFETTEEKLKRLAESGGGGGGGTSTAVAEQFPRTHNPEGGAFVSRVPPAQLERAGYDTSGPGKPSSGTSSSSSGSSGSGGGGKGAAAPRQGQVTREDLEAAGADFEVMPGFAVVNGVVYQLAPDGQTYDFKGNAPKEVMAVVHEKERKALLAELQASRAPKIDEHGQRLTASTNPQTGEPSIKAETGLAQSRIVGSAGAEVGSRNEFAVREFGRTYDELLPEEAVELEKNYMGAINQSIAREGQQAEVFASHQAEVAHSRQQQLAKQQQADEFYRTRPKDEFAAFAEGGTYGAGVANKTEEQRRLEVTGATAFPGEDFVQGAPAEPIFMNNDPVGAPPRDARGALMQAERLSRLQPGNEWRAFSRTNGQRTFWDGNWWVMRNGRWTMEETEGFSGDFTPSQRAAPRRPAGDGTTFAGVVDTPFVKLPPVGPGPDLPPDEPPPPPVQSRPQVPLVLAGGHPGFFTEEPIVAFGAISGKPKFVAGEEGEEFITVRNQQQMNRDGILSPRQKKMLAAMNGMPV